MFVGTDPKELPFVTFLLFNENLEDYFEAQIDMQKAAISEALAEFWNEINS